MANSQLFTNFFFIFLILSFDTLLGQSQSPAVVVTFESKNSSVNEKFSTEGKLIHDISVKLTANADSSTVLKIEALPVSTAATSDYQIIEETLFIPKGSAANTIYTISISIINDTITEGSEFLVLKLSSVDKYNKFTSISPDDLHVVTIINSKEPSTFNDKTNFKAPDFRVDIGTNFDFLNGVDASGLYANVVAFHPDLFGKVGIVAGIRQSRPLSDSIRLDKRQDSSYRRLSFSGNPSDSVTYERTRLEIISSESDFDNTTLYFNPIFSLFNNENASMYLGLDFGVTRRKYIANFQLDTLSTDVVSFPSSVNRPPRISRLPERIENIFFDFSFGIKIPIRYSINKLNIDITPTFGINSSAITPRFYAGFYFNAIELKSGINLGGEVIGFFKDKNPRRNFTIVSSVFSPLVSIYLSKAFNIEPLGRYKP